MANQNRSVLQAILDLAAAVLVALAIVFARQDVTAYAVWAGVGGVLLFITALVMRMGAPFDAASTPLPRTTDAEPT
jgi:hypothetical protein